MELLAKAPVLGCAGKMQRQRQRGSAMGSLVAGALNRWICRAVAPPSRAPTATAPRVRLRDGRHLAYAESGVSKDDARFKVVFSHGFTGSRLDTVRPAPVSAPTRRPLLPFRCGFGRRGPGSVLFVVYASEWGISIGKSFELFWICCCSFSHPVLVHIAGAIAEISGIALRGNLLRFSRRLTTHFLSITSFLASHQIHRIKRIRFCQQILTDRILKLNF
jgi:hypothetical protein